MSKQKWKLLGSDSSLDRLLEGVSRFYGGSNIRIQGETLLNSRGPISGVRVILARGRYRFEMEVVND